MLKLAEKGDQQALSPYARSLVLPDAGNRFKFVFGDELGPLMASTSAPMRGGTEADTPKLLSMIITGKLMDVEAVRFDDSCNERATPVEYPFLLLRQRTLSENTANRYKSRLTLSLNALRAKK